MVLSFYCLWFFIREIPRGFIEDVRAVYFLVEET